MLILFWLLLIGALIQQSCCVDIITTIAGTGASSYSGDNGQAISASLYGASAVVVDSSGIYNLFKYFLFIFYVHFNVGNIYIADRYNSCIRKVTVLTGIITTIAGTGSASYSGDNSQATSAALNNPHKVGIDSSGMTFVLHIYNNF